MSALDRLGVENGAKELRDCFLVVGSRPAGAGFPVQPDDPLFKPLLAPMADRRIAHSKTLRDRSVRLATGRGQHDLRAPYQTVSRRARPTDALELVALPITQRQSPFWRSTDARHDPLRATANHRRSVFFCKAIC